MLGSGSNTLDRVGVARSSALASPQQRRYWHLLEDVVRKNLTQKRGVARYFLGNSSKGGIVGSEDSLVAGREFSEESLSLGSLGQSRGDTNESGQVGGTALSA